MNINDLYLLAQENAKHIAVLNDDFTALASNYVELKSTVVSVSKDVEWLCKFFWVAVTASIGALVTNIWQLIKMDKKNSSLK